MLIFLIPGPLFSFLNLVNHNKRNAVSNMIYVIYAEGPVGQVACNFAYLSESNAADQLNKLNRFLVMIIVNM